MKDFQPALQFFMIDLGLIVLMILLYEMCY